MSAQSRATSRASTAARAGSGTSSDVVLEASGLHKRFVTGRNWIGRPSVWLDAVKDVSLSLRAGETLALVGESGSGKSTTARLVTQLETPDSGTVRVMGGLLRRSRTVGPH